LGSFAVLIGLLALATLLTIAPTQAASPRRIQPAADRPPDIVMLVIDDLPQIDDRIWERLPTIRRLFLDSGVRFTNAYGQDPLCCPGRANLLTGQWSRHHGVTTNKATLFDPRVTIATELQAKGYWTGMFGKYFNGMFAIPDWTPPGWHRTFLIAGAYFNYRALVDGREARFGTAPEDYSTTQVRRHALRALRRLPSPTRPVFLWLAPYAVHGGRDETGALLRTGVAAPQDRGAPACDGIDPWVTAATQDRDLTDKPAFLSVRSPVGSGSIRRPCESLLSVDRMLGAVLAELDAAGRPEPLVILTSDNGMGWGAYGWYDKRVPYATPIPLFISWPGVVGPNHRKVATTVSNIDIAPTLCAIAGCVMGPFPNGHPVDGKSFLPVLLGDTSRMGREVVFEEHAAVGGLVVPWRSVRTTEEAAIGRWVYTEYASGEKELYDVSRGPCWTWQVGDPGDPCQLTNLAGVPAYAPIQARLAATLAAQDEHPVSVLRRPRPR
jgi:arylsulfatase A-like enzyme